MEQIQTPLLSVIIPVYNAEDYIEQCVSSVLNEAVCPMEVICVDDGSTDSSTVILERIAADDKRVRVIKQCNSSAGAARNHGLRYAKGEFVHFLDADDRLCSGIYSRSVKLLQETQSDVCVFQYISYDNSTGKMRKRPCLLNSRDRVTSFRSEPAFFIYNMVAPWNKVYRREWLEKHALRFDEIVCGNDRGFYFRMLAAGGSFVLSADCGVIYREKNSKSLTGSNRYRHLDSLFFAWDSSMKAMEEESAEIRAMTLDCIMKDIFGVLQQAPLEKRKETLEKLKHRFSQTDLSCMSALPVPCTWHDDFEQIRTGNHSREFNDWSGSIFTRVITGCRIWGIRGYIVKTLAK